MVVTSSSHHVTELMNSEWRMSSLLDTRSEQCMILIARDKKPWTQKTTVLLRGHISAPYSSTNRAVFLQTRSLAHREMSRRRYSAYQRSLTTPAAGPRLPLVCWWTVWKMGELSNWISLVLHNVARNDRLVNIEDTSLISFVGSSNNLVCIFSPLPRRRQIVAQGWFNVRNPSAYTRARNTNSPSLLQLLWE